MIVLITGVSGFVGSHLAEYCLTIPDCIVHGTTRHRSKLDNIASFANKLILHDCNIIDAHSVSSVVKQVQPDIIFHLAAQSFVPSSWTAPRETMETNVEGTINILEAVREYRPKCIVQIAGSSEEYGKVEMYETPIKEDNPLRPLSPYGVSKVAQDLLGYQYAKSYGLKVIRTRAFNHEGPRRGDVFVTAAFAKQVIQIERGLSTRIEVGNLDAIRDFTDVRDVVRAYWIAALHGSYGEVYNIASGVGITMGQLLREFIKHSAINKSLNESKEITIETVAKLSRPSDVPILIGDASKMRRLGWLPEISQDQMIKDILEYWRNKV